jgi:uncharacterized hydrophobic protein (TIGR00271 family)
MKTIHYLYREAHASYIESLKNVETEQEVLFHCYESIEELSSMDCSAVSHLVTTGTLAQIKEVMQFAKTHDLSLGIVPLSEQPKLTKILDLPRKAEEAFLQALQPAERKVDMFYCNDLLVLNDVRIGNCSTLKSFEYDYMNDSIWVRLKHFWQSWREKEPLKHHLFTIKTAKEDEKQFSAVGLIGLDYDNRSWVASALKPNLGSGDGQHILAVLAPTSLFQFFISQPLSMLMSSKESRKLPRSLGFIKSDRIAIDCKEPLEVLIDDNTSMQTPVELRSEEGVLALSVGEAFWERQSSARSDRSSIRLDNIPKDEEQIAYLSKGVPLFEHASKEQYATLFGSLREEGKLSSTFMTLLILATMIATFGLFINSGSVIIGAMLLAPLMQPIVSLSMGVLRQDALMQSNAFKTIVIGVVAVLLTSGVIALFVPIERLTSEMAGRLSPTLLDLFVAIVSGIAAAYAKNNEKIMSSLAGVAIAVALVPPIAVAGIGIGWGEWSMFMAAFLLFVTNLVGIVLAAAMTFMVLGYSPIKIARKGIVIWMLIVVVVAIPLYSSFSQMQENARIQKLLTDTYFDVGNKRLALSHIEVLRHKGAPQIRCEVISSGVLTDSDKAYLKEVITQTVGREIEIIATFRYRL